jgi:hypothetical protein
MTIRGNREQRLERIVRAIRWNIWRLTLLFAIGGGIFPLTARMVAAQGPQDEVEGLIEALQSVSEGDVGYPPSMSGHSFLPIGKSEMGTMLFGQPAPASSDAMRELVKRGAAAVPHLIAHLDDAWPTKIAIGHDGGFGGMFFPNEYDFNARTIEKVPEGVNRDWPDDGDDPDNHTVTVGDLCFVALGQIVNREFSAVRYQPTACIMINSPTASSTLPTSPHPNSDSSPAPPPGFDSSSTPQQLTRRLKSGCGGRLHNPVVGSGVPVSRSWSLSMPASANAFPAAMFPAIMFRAGLWQPKS